MRDLRTLRKAAGMTQPGLAVATGIERTRISLAENGYVKLKPEEREAVRRVVVAELERLTAQRTSLIQECAV